MTFSPASGAARINSSIRSIPAPCRSITNCTSSRTVVRKLGSAVDSISLSKRSMAWIRCVNSGCAAMLAVQAKHRRMACLENLAAAIVHVYAAGKARIEASDRPHDVDALELIPAVFFENRRVLHSVFVGTGRAVAVSGIGVPRRRRIGMVVCDLSVLYYDVMRQYASNSLMEAAADSIIGHLEVRPRTGPAGVQFLERLLGKM